jgi:ketosteroid isomerase-like protein
VWNLPGSGRGKSDFLSYIAGLTTDWEMIFYRIDEYLAQDDRVVAIGSTSWRNKRTGKIVLTPKVDIWRMKDGKAVQFSEFYDTAKLIAAAQP